MTRELTEISFGAASCRIYRDAPQWESRRTAAIGQFHCANAEDGAAVLAQSNEILRSEGFETVIGPMDGDTWHRYRVVTETDGTSPFFMEPTSGPHDLAAFRLADFHPISSYLSARASLDDAIGSGPPIAIDGIGVQTWDGKDAKALIGKLFEFSSHGFSRNAFFKPIELPEFLKLYEPIIPAIDPHLVLFALSGAEPVGFLFGFPNGAPTQQRADVVLKTYASAKPGVGRLLADAFHRTARGLGFSNVIHALMHVDNVSRKRSELHGATIFRRYALMGRRLTP
jgi:hypothetical protein